MRKDHVIALDGPSGSGKSTVAKKIAEALDLIYIDTGAMFRAVAYVLQHTGIDFTKPKLTVEEEATIQKFYQDHYFKYAPAPGVLVQLDNLNLTDVIREHHVSKLASQISKYKVIRDFLAQWQRNIVKDRPAILDGRDIGTVIFPNALLKVYLTASPHERAFRRLAELKVRGQNELDYEVILKDIQDRDYQDMNREIAPLKRADDAIELDSTGKSIEQMVADVMGMWNEKKAQQ